MPKGCAQRGLNCQCLACEADVIGWHFLYLLKTFLVTKLGGRFRQVPANLASAEVDFWRPQLPKRVMKSHVLICGGPNYHSESPMTTASHQLPQRVIKCAKKFLPLQSSFWLFYFVDIFVFFFAAESTSGGPNYQIES